MPEVPIPIEVIDPPAPIIAVTDAPTKGAYPNPGVEPRDTINPPLGNSFIFTSLSLMNKDPFSNLTPVNTTLVIPAIVFSTIE